MLLLVVYNASRPHVGVLGAVPGAPGAYGNLERHPDYERIPGLLVLRLDAPLFYANASLVRDRIKWLVGASDAVPTAVILEAGANADLDITSAEMLEELARSLESVGIGFGLADVRQPVVEMLRRTGLLATIGEDHVYHTVDEAVRSLGRT
jgi:sulfate permease, SulP family